MARKLIVEIIGDSASLERSLHNSGTAAQGFTNRLGGLAKAALIAAGASGIGALGLALKVGWDRWSQTTKLAAQTEAVIKSTGGVANVTAKQVDELANSIQRKSGIDEHQIIAGENMLLSFRNVRNELGAGNDIFNQATQAVADYSARTGTDATTAAKLFGKALEDPIGKVSALARAGIVFTEAQKEQIKAMVEAGDTMGAQKLILAQLTDRYGGAADAAGKTLPGQIQIAKLTMEDFAATLIGKSIPVIESVISTVRDHWPEIMATIGPIMAQVKEVIGTVLTDVEAFWNEFGGTITKVLTVAAAVVRSDLKIIGDIFKIFGDILRGDWGKLWTDVKSLVVDAVKQILTVVTGFGSLLLDAGKGIGGALMDGIASGLNLAKRAVFDVLDAAIIDPINTLIGYLDDVHISLPSVDTHIPGVGKVGGGSFGFDIPRIPKLDTGGFITQSGIAMVHKGETVVPAGAGGGPVYLTVNVSGVADEKFAVALGDRIAVGLRGGRIPQLASAIHAL